MKALIVYGGWEGHEPEPVAKVFEKELKARGFDVEMSGTLEAFEDLDKLKALDVIVPNWTMGDISGEQWKAVDEAVRGGVGIAGCHGGMGDSMRGCLGWQWMTGGQFVGHPLTGEYEVRLTETTNPITACCPNAFTYNSEQYYMLIDPGINVLAVTTHDYDGHKIDMPVVWTKTWGKGRVFYSNIGHKAQEFVDYQYVLEMTINGMVWAAEGKAAAK